MPGHPCKASEELVRKTSWKGRSGWDREGSCPQKRLWQLEAAGAGTGSRDEGLSTMEGGTGREQTGSGAGI